MDPGRYIPTVFLGLPVWGSQSTPFILPGSQVLHCMPRSESLSSKFGPLPVSSRLGLGFRV